MLIPGAQMGDASDIPDQLYFFHLRDRDAEGRLDLPHPRVPRALAGPGDLFQKIAAIGIVGSPNGPIRFANELRNNMQVTDGGKER